MKNSLLDVENLASRFHQVYEIELERQGKKNQNTQKCIQNYPKKSKIWTES